MRSARDSGEDAQLDPEVIACVERGIIDFSEDRVTYNLNQRKSYVWNDPEEWVRCRCVAFLIRQKGYPANRLRTEVLVPRRVPGDYADVVVYKDDACKTPYLVVETKGAGQSETGRRQWIEQAFGNAHSLRSPYALYDEYLAIRGLPSSILYDIDGYPPGEREQNIRGGREDVPEQYGDTPIYRFIAGSESDIKTVRPALLESRIRRAHSLIWAGGKRDPLSAFDEWSKLVFAKVLDERTTPSGDPRRFQVGENETTAAVATRVHELFREASRQDPTIFPASVRIELNDRKIHDVVQVLQEISLVRTDIDTIGTAFENFFPSVFRGELGQYFTMRQLSRFVVAILGIRHSDYVIDPAAVFHLSYLSATHMIVVRELGNPLAMSFVRWFAGIRSRNGRRS